MVNQNSMWKHDFKPRANRGKTSYDWYWFSCSSWYSVCQIGRFSLEYRKLIGFELLRHKIGLKNSRHVFIQSEAKLKPILTYSHSFSRALRQLHIFISSFDWLTGLSVPFVTDQSNYYGFRFT